MPILAEACPAKTVCDMEFLEVPLIDDDIYKLLVRFGINLVFLILIVVFAISRRERDREFTFTVVMLNIIVFFICFTMKKLELDLGLALGLFAVFGVLRYRTDAIRPKQMTYLFIVIGIAVINSLSNKKTSYAEVALVNAIIFGSAMLKEWVVGRPVRNSRPVGQGGSESAPTAKQKRDKGNGGAKKPPRYTVEYDRPEWLGVERRQDLLRDLQQRLGMDVDRVEVKSIDLTQSKATLTVWPRTSKLPESAAADSDEPSS